MLWLCPLGASAQDVARAAQKVGGTHLLLNVLDAQGAEVVGRMSNVRDLVDAVVEDLRRLAVDPKIVVGASFTGVIAQHLMVHEGLTVTGGVLLSTWGWTDPQLKAMLQLLSDLEDHAPDQVFVDGFIALSVSRKLFGLGAIVPSIRNTMLKRATMRDWRRGSFLRLVRDHDLRDALRGFGGPVVVGCGCEDLLTPPPHSRRLAALFDAGEFHEVPGVAHNLLVEKPRVVAGWVESVAARLRIPASSESAG